MLESEKQCLAEWLGAPALQADDDHAENMALPILDEAAWLQAEWFSDGLWPQEAVWEEEGGAEMPVWDAADVAAATRGTGLNQMLWTTLAASAAAVTAAASASASAAPLEKQALQAEQVQVYRAEVPSENVQPPVQRVQTFAAAPQRAAGLEKPPATAKAASLATPLAEQAVESVSEAPLAASAGINAPHTARVAAVEPQPLPEAGSAPQAQPYHVQTSATYGKYIDVADFGADPSGKTDSLAAIRAALAAAHREKAMLYLKGKFYVSDQIVIDQSVSGVRGLFGEGMGKTLIQFDKAQQGVFNPNTNHDDIRPYAGILIDGQSGKTVANLSVQYTNPDFYRPKQSYFGKVSGILVNDADRTLIDRVEVSGVNRAGVFFTSTAALGKENGAQATYKERVADGSINDSYAKLPLGENNRVIDSKLHDNRVAGLMVAYQKNFTASGNHLANNGHKADGGTGYGATVMAGSYNYGITFTKNTTDHNYRKGLDVHDGTGITITHNTLNGDRLYGIAVYNRQFAMDKVKISGNTITQDPSFRLANDDDMGAYYRLYSGIQVQTNTQFKQLPHDNTGYFEISNNTIKQLALYGTSPQQYGIEFRNHEQKMDYVLNITGNRISGESSKYLIAVINDTQDPESGAKGAGSGTINISRNQAEIGEIAVNAMPVYIEERNSDGQPYRGSITVDHNQFNIKSSAHGTPEFLLARSNAAVYNVSNNTLKLGGKINDGIVHIQNYGKGAGAPDVNVVNNKLHTDLPGALYATWLRPNEADVYAAGNTHNGSALGNINSANSKLGLSDVLGNISKTVTAAQSSAYQYENRATVKVEDNIVGGVM